MPFLLFSRTGAHPGAPPHARIREGRPCDRRPGAVPAGPGHPPSTVPDPWGPGPTVTPPRTRSPRRPRPSSYLRGLRGSAAPRSSSHQMRLPAPSGLQPQRSARPSTRARPRPPVASPSAQRGAGGAGRWRRPPPAADRGRRRRLGTPGREQPQHGRTAGVHHGVGDQFGDEQDQRLGERLVGLYPGPGEPRAGPPPGPPHLRGVGPDLQLHLKHLHRSHHPNRRTHRLAPHEGHDRSHFLHDQNNDQSRGHRT